MGGRWRDGGIQGDAGTGGNAGMRPARHRMTLSWLWGCAIQHPRPLTEGTHSHNPTAWNWLMCRTWSMAAANSLYLPHPSSLSHPCLCLVLPVPR